jgi:nitrite reductase/ring-hydroxylating ferredoxin subunit
MAIIEDSASEALGSVRFPITSPLHVAAPRYYDRDFYQLEKEYLWPRTWQMACRLEEIPDPGDWVEYEICDQSIVIVRQGDHSVKAFHNRCPHRATQLCKGVGRAPAGQLVCPFHGWRFNLDGTNSRVYGADGFEPQLIDPDTIRLSECQVDTWGACVWINMDPDARPLREHLSPAAAFLETCGVDNMRVWWWKELILHANWKVAQEAFFEGYHVAQSHPQLTMGAGMDYSPDGAEYLTFENGHALFRGREKPSIGGGRTTPDDFIARSRLLWEGQDAMTLERDLRVFEGIRHKVPEDEPFGPAAVAALYEYAAGAGIPMPSPEAARLWGGDVYLFPNYLMLPMYGNMEAYRSRPYNDDPEWCRFEIWSLTTYPEGHEPGRARLKGRFDKDDVDNWGLIPRQDIGNIERQQRGLHSRTYKESILSSKWERAITNMHEELDRYLAH